MNAIAIELKAMAARLRELFPESNHIELHAKNYDDGRKEDEVALHRVGEYRVGSAMMRRLGIGTRSKSVFPEDHDRPDGWSAMRGNLDGVEFVVFCTSLPPSCRIEVETRRIPKTATVDTGEFIEVQERVVKCGNAEAVA